MPIGKRYNLTRAARPEVLPEFQAFIDDSCVQSGLDQQVASELKTAVAEACRNIIQHGYAGMNPGSIIFSMTCYPSHIAIDIHDFGQPFEPEQMDAPEPEDRDSFGLRIIYETMDQIEYEASALGNHLHFIRWLVENQARPG